MVTYGLSWHRHHPNTYQDLTVFWGGGTRVRDVPHVIYFVVFGEVLLSPCLSVLVQETTPNPQSPIGDHSGMHTRANVSAYPVRGKYLFTIPWSGTLLWGGRIYIWVFVEHSPSWSAPWGWVINDKWRSVFHYHSGMPPHGPLPPCHPPNG